MIKNCKDIYNLLRLNGSHFLRLPFAGHKHKFDENTHAQTFSFVVDRLVK